MCNMCNDSHHTVGLPRRKSVPTSTPTPPTRPPVSQEEYAVLKRIADALAETDDEPAEPHS